MINHNLNLKLFFLVKVFFIYFIICLKSYADNPKIPADLIVLGTNNAPVKIKIFSSLTCPHCANFHINVVSEIKKEYIDSGKVQLIFIDFPLDQVAFNASKLLHCLDKKKQLEFLDIIYETQIKWTEGSNLSGINKKNLIKFSKDFEKQINKIKNNEIRNSLSQLLETIKND